MNYVEKSKFYTESATELAREVNRLSRLVRDAVFQKALERFKLNGLTTMNTIPKNQGYFKYTPKQRDYVLSETATPATCESDPESVRIAAGKPFRGDTDLLEKPYEICLTDCEGDLRMAVEKGEEAVAAVLLEKLYQRFWFGSPQLGQFGLTNHPLTEKIESTFTWAQASNNQIAQQLIEAMDGMMNPAVIVAQNAYRQSLGLSDENQIVNACSLRGDCVTSIIQKQEGNLFTGAIKTSKDMSNRPEFAGQNVALVYDMGSVFMNASDVIYLDAMPTQNGKKVKAMRMINTSGMHVEYADSLKLIVGI